MSMTLEQTTALYASVLRQLLPVGGYDRSPDTIIAKDIYAHAKALAQADLHAKRLLDFVSGIPVELINEYENELGLPLKCSVNATKTIEERLHLINWIQSTGNVLNRDYLEQLLDLFGVILLELVKYIPMQCTASCIDAVNSERLRYKVKLIVAEPIPVDMQCVIDNYLPAYCRYDINPVPLAYFTSKPYPTYIVESVATTFDMHDAVVKLPIYPDIEQVSTAFVMHDAQITKQIAYLTYSNAEPETVSTAFVMHDAQITKQVAYLTYSNAEPETVSTAFVMHDAQITKTIAYLTYSNAEPETVSTAFVMRDAQITNLTKDEIL